MTDTIAEQIDEKITYLENFVNLQSYDNTAHMALSEYQKTKRLKHFHKELKTASRKGLHISNVELFDYMEEKRKAREAFDKALGRDYSDFIFDDEDAKRLCSKTIDDSTQLEQQAVLNYLSRYENIGKTFREIQNSLRTTAPFKTMVVESKTVVIKQTIERMVNAGSLRIEGKLYFSI
jgi:hypothetical protein